MARRGFLGAVLDAFERAQDTTNANELFFGGGLFSSPSATGIQINQQTALQATAVMACVTVLANDVSKMTPALYRKVDVLGKSKVGRRTVEPKDNPLAALLLRPNDWQTWPEFCRQMMVGFLMRGNAYAVIVRDERANPVMFVPINPDRVALWEAPGGSLFWQVTRAGLHEMAVLRNEPYLIPYRDVFHLKDLSANGLIGMSRIAIAREAIALALGQEQQYARLMGNGARPSGILSTDKNLSPEAAERNKARWQEAHGGLMKGGGTAVLEGGLKWTPLSLDAVDLQFLQMRQFQISEIARMFRVPMHMIGDLSKGTFNNITQQSQEYRNNTLMDHVDVWEKRFGFQFDLDAEDLLVDFDEGALLKADVLTRYNVGRIGKLSGLITTNEWREPEGFDPVEGGDEIMNPVNMAALGSDTTGTAPDGAGRPAGTPDSGAKGEQEPVNDTTEE